MMKDAIRSRNHNCTMYYRHRNTEIEGSVSTHVAACFCQLQEEGEEKNKSELKGNERVREVLEVWRNFFLIPLIWYSS